MEIQVQFSHHERPHLTHTQTHATPSHQVEETLLPPTLIGTRAGFDYPFSFRLTLQQQREVMESRQQAGAGAGGRPNQLLVAVRCFPLDLFEGQKGRVQDLTKPPFYAPHSWPLESTLRVNREYAHVKQRQVYYHGAQRKWKGGSEPADVFMHSRVGTNLLTMQHRDEGKTYVLAVQLVRVVPIPDLYQRVLAYPDTPSIAASLERIKDSFKVTCVDSDDEDCGGAGGGGGGAGAMATVTRLSLRCPLGLTPIQTPARGKDCQHLQCFDLDTFLRFNEKGSAAGWKCGVCDRRLTLEDVRVDAFMQDVIRQIEARKLANEDLDSVQIDHEGSWSLYNSAAHSNSRKRKADLLRAEAIDDSDKEDRKPAAPKPTANGTAASASASLASSAAAARRPAASEAIDLTLSSDEEDNTVPTSRLAAPAPAASSAASAAASAGPDLPALVELVDDDPPAVARSPLPPLPPARQAPPSSAAATAAATNPGIPPYRPHIVNPAAHYITHTPMASAAAMQSLQQQQQLQHQQTLNALMSEDTHNLLYGGGGAGGAGGGGAGGGGRYL